MRVDGARFGRSYRSDARGDSDLTDDRCAQLASDCPKFCRRMSGRTCTRTGIPAAGVLGGTSPMTTLRTATIDARFEGSAARALAQRV